MCEPVHPGETLREDLDELGLSAAELAQRTLLGESCERLTS